MLLQRFVAVFASAVGISVLASTVRAASEFIAPPNAGIVDVQDYGAIPDDGKDDTEALQKALDAYPHGFRVIYLRNGVYQVTKTLNWPAGVNSGQYMKYTTLQGESTDGVILKVPDATPGFTDPNKPQSVIFTGVQPAQHFGNEVRNLTIDTGKNNPGAIGLQFNASNYGCVRNVTIRSGDGQGQIGLDMSFTGEIGPLLIKGLLVEGFDYGIATKENEASQTLDRITIKNPNKCGILNRNQSIMLRNFTFSGSTMAIHNADHSGMVMLDEGDLTYTGPAPAPVAVLHARQAAATFLRHIKTKGFSGVASVEGKPELDAKGDDVEEWTSAPVKSLFSSPAKSLNLPVKETPVAPLDPDFSHWADVRDYGATPGDDTDDTAAIQKAIDSGKSTVWFPTGDNGKGKFVVNGTLHVRGNVAHLIGFTGLLAGNGLVRFEDGTAPVVVAERIAFGFFSKIRAEVVTKRTVAFVDCTIDSGLTHTGPGELFIENVVTFGVFKGGPVWCRQINPEITGTHLLVDGATVWIHGMKVEVKGTIVEARNNATVEMLGLFVYSSHRLDESPMFICRDSKLSATFREKANFPKPYPTIVRETRKGVTRDWKNPTQSGSAGALFTGYPQPSVAAPATVKAAKAEAISPSEIKLSWQSESPDVDGFLVERSTDGSTWTKAGDVPLDSREYVDGGLKFGDKFQYRICAYNESGSSAASEVVVATTPANTGPPQAPAAVTAVTGADSKAVVTWTDQSNNEEHFRVERKTVSGDAPKGSEWSARGEVTPNVTRYEDSTVAAGAGYLYRVSAVNSIGAASADLDTPVYVLPKGWTAGPLGNPPAGGGVVYDGATGGFNILADGMDIAGKADQFYFIRHAREGNGMIQARCTAYTETATYSKAGLMIRDGEDPGAAFVMVTMRPDNSVSLAYRPAAGAEVVKVQPDIGGSPPKWMRLARIGNQFRGFYSNADKPKGEDDWAELSPPPAIEMNTSALWGMAMAPQAVGSFATAKFIGLSETDKVDLPPIAADLSVAQARSVLAPKGPDAVAVDATKLPAGWAAFNIGGATQGSTTADESAKNFEVSSNGKAIWGGNDQCHFVGREIEGDFEISAHVLSMVDTGPYASCGLMARAGTDANAPFCSMLVKPPDLYVNMIFRTKPGAGAEQTSWEGPGAASKWIKLVRKGDVFTAFQSKDGRGWDPIGGPREVALPKGLKIGFAASSYAPDRVTTGKFADVTITPAK